VGARAVRVWVEGEDVPGMGGFVWGGGGGPFGPNFEVKYKKGGGGSL